jgi:pimeloyl-ACP methyl ester carboxylesterase
MRLALRWLTALVGLSLLASLAIAVRAFRFELSGFDRLPSTVARVDGGPLSAAREVSFAAGGIPIKGWDVESRNGATIVLMHGSGADRMQMVPMAELLAARGFGVLLYDAPGHGESGGVVSWEEADVRALEAAVAWVKELPAGAERVGVFAYSASTAVAIQGTARDPHIEALAMVGTYADGDVVTRFQYRKYGVLSWGAAFLADVWAGTHPSEDHPGRLIAQVSPRPLLIIGGTEDVMMPPAQGRALFDRARDPRELWIIPGAGHLDLAKRGPELYGERTVDFFARALVPAPRAAQK